MTKGYIRFVDWIPTAVGYSISSVRSDILGTLPDKSWGFFILLGRTLGIKIESIRTVIYFLVLTETHRTKRLDIFAIWSACLLCLFRLPDQHIYCMTEVFVTSSVLMATAVLLPFVTTRKPLCTFLQTHYYTTHFIMNFSSRMVFITKQWTTSE